MRGRKYIVVILLTWLVLIILGIALAFDGPRMEAAEEAHLQSLAARGAEIFAQNCIVCHGISGQGHVGPALNGEALRGDPREDTDLYEMLYRTVAHGRPGTSDPTWVMLENDQWASYTAMPAWSQEAGGTLNELHLRAVVYFIMMGDWSQVGRLVPEPNMATNDDGTVSREATLARMPTGVNISAEASRRGRELFYDRACISCHAIGGMGNTIGPDLSKVGAWATNLSEEEWRAFLSAWIKNPPSVPNRTPASC